MLSRLSPLLRGGHAHRLRPLHSSVRNSSSIGKTVRVGCASGFWGDTPMAPEQLIHHGRVDYLIFDYLSELTMSLLTAAKQKNPAVGGYAHDFVLYGVGPHLHEIKHRGKEDLLQLSFIPPPLIRVFVDLMITDFVNITYWHDIIYNLHPIAEHRL